MDTNSLLNVLPYVLLGVFPSILWLLLYLKEDVHPEPNQMVIKIFFFGMGSAVLAFVAQSFIIWVQHRLPLEEFFLFLGNGKEAAWPLFLNLIIFAPLTEEILKFAVARLGAIRNPAFDEPFDAMLYMMIAALGFAALENVFALIQSSENLAFTFAIRSVGAILLHALASGMFGYFLAISMLNRKRKYLYLLTGLITAVLIHSIFNYLIGLTFGFAQANATISHVAAASLVTFLSCVAVIVFFLLNRLKKVSSACKI